MHTINDVEILRVGKWKGIPITQSDLAEFAQVNNSEEFPSVIGHPTKELKHLGKNVVNSLRVVGDRLVQSIQNVSDFGKEAISEWLPNRSIRFDPVTKKIHHTGFLPIGIEPAVEGLAAVQFSELDDFEDSAEDSQYIEFSTTPKINMEELEALKAQFVEFQKATQTKTEALEAQNAELTVSLQKVVANQAERPTDFSKIIDDAIASGKILSWQKPLFNALDPFKPVDFSKEGDRTARLELIKSELGKWGEIVSFGKAPMGEMDDDGDDDDVKEAKKKEKAMFEKKDGK